MKKIILSLSVILLLSAPLLYGQFKHKDMPKHKALLEKLSLTDQQEDQIAKIRTQHQEKAIDLRAEIAKQRLQIKEEMRSKTLDENKIRSLTQKVSDLQAQLKASQVDMWLSTHKLLDDKQKEIWRDAGPMLGMMDDHMMKRGRMPHKRMMED